MSFFWKYLRFFAGNAGGPYRTNVEQWPSTKHGSADESANDANVVDAATSTATSAATATDAHATGGGSKLVDKLLFGENKRKCLVQLLGKKLVLDGWVLIGIIIWYSFNML